MRLVEGDNERSEKRGQNDRMRRGMRTEEIKFKKSEGNMYLETLRLKLARSSGQSEKMNATELKIQDTFCQLMCELVFSYCPHILFQILRPDKCSFQWKREPDSRSNKYDSPLLN